MTREEAFDCGVRCQNMDSETAQRTFYSAYGIRSTIMTVPSGARDNTTYDYWCPESDPPSAMMDEFWYGYYSEPRPDGAVYDREAADLENFHNMMDRIYR